MFGRRKAERIRLSPLKVLLYLASHERKDRASSPEKLGQEIGIGGYDTITQSYLWLLEHRYIAAAPGTPTTASSEIRDPREFIVTPLGQKALKPYLATFTLEEVLSVAALTLVLGFALGPTYALIQLYPSYASVLILIDVMVVVVIAGIMTVVLKVGRKRYKVRAASLIESVTDRG
jgi:hypothetical protein